MAKSRTKNVSAATKARSKTKPGASKGGSVKLPETSGMACPPTRSSSKRTSARSADNAGGEAGLGCASPSPMASVVPKRVAPRF